MLCASVRERAAALFQDLMLEVAGGGLHPLPHRTFPAHQATAAFHFLAKAKHIGKVVIGFSDQTPALRPARCPR